MPDPAPDGRRPLSLRSVCLIAALVTAIAAVWYTRRLDAVPVYLQHDEVNFAIQAHAIATSGRDAGGQSLPLYFREQGFEIGRDPIYIYLAAAALSVLPPEEHTLRLPSVLAALLSIFLTVLVAYELFGSATAAIVAGLLLATSPALFIHGRKALSVIFPIPFVTWWLLFVLRYERTGRLRDVGLAAAGLGVSVYSYLAMMVLAPVYALVTAAVIVRKRQWAHGAIAAGVLALAVMPAAVRHLDQPGQYTNLISSYRIYDARLDPLRGARELVGWSSLSRRADVYWDSLNPGLLFFSGESVLTDSTRQAGALPLAFLVLLPVGLALLLRRPLSTKGAIIVAGLATAPLPAVLVGAPGLYRFLAILPFAALVATAGFWLLWSRQRAWSRAAAIAAVVSALVLFHSFHRYYLTEWPIASAGYFGGNMRGAITAVLQAAPPRTSGLIFLGPGVPYLDRYFELYRRLHGRDDLRTQVRGLDVQHSDWRSAPGGSAAIVAATDAAAAAAMHAAGWRQAGVFAEPGGRPSFKVFTSPVRRAAAITKPRRATPGR